MLTTKSSNILEETNVAYLQICSVVDDDHMGSFCLVFEDGTATSAVDLHQKLNGIAGPFKLTMTPFSIGTMTKQFTWVDFDWKLETSQEKSRRLAKDAQVHELDLKFASLKEECNLAGLADWSDVHIITNTYMIDEESQSSIVLGGMTVNMAEVIDHLSANIQSEVANSHIIGICGRPPSVTFASGLKLYRQQLRWGL